MASFALNSLHLFFLLSLFKFYTHTKAQDGDLTAANCNTAINYTYGTAYEQNLNLTLSFLVSSASLNGFSNVTMGQNQNVVYGHLQCRGDVSNQNCEACAKAAATEIKELCPNQKEASLVDTDCSLGYSYQPFSAEADSYPTVRIFNVENASDPVYFNQQLGNLLKNLTSEAASSSSKLATGNTDLTDVVKIYAMALCIRDSAESSCLTCLQNLTSQIPNCCGGKVGARIISMGCNLRYETYTFLLSPPSSPPPELASPPSSSPQLSERNPNSTETTNLTNHSGKQSSSKKIAIVVVPAAISSIMIFIISGCLLCRNSKKKRSDSFHIEDKGSFDSPLISLSTLKLATKNFSDANKIGQGGFGPVYKGKLPDGRKIAIKRLSSSSGQGLAELKTEVMLVAKLLHKNLVKLLGFCLEDKEKLLVYEYLPNGSLDKILFDQNKKSELEWKRRYKIIVGIAQGLLYLHEDSQLRIVHRDLKASNILLDEQMNPKISDFGLARLFPGSMTQANTNRIAGTYGYIAPEYVKSGKFSTKSDVYSFGILVLEILAGRKNSYFRNSVNLQSHAWHHWSNGTALEIMDPALVYQCPRHEVLKCIYIGLLCVQDAANDRPTMSDIIMMLNSSTLTSPPLSRPAFYVPKEGSSNSTIENPCASSYPAQSPSEVLQQSINEVTVSEIDPR